MRPIISPHQLLLIRPVFLVLLVLVSQWLVTSGQLQQEQHQWSPGSPGHQEHIDRRLPNSSKHKLAQPDSKFNPVVFVPGDGGSQLEAKLNKTTRRHYICWLQSDWFDIWLNVHLLTPVAFDCLADNMRLTFDKTTGLTSNTPGVQIRPTNFGTLASVTYLDIYHLPLTGYFGNIAETLAKVNGLEPEREMVGAAFDFRKAPNELATFFDNLTSLIEHTYVNNGHRPVTLICHSMGCLNTFYLLNSKTDQWRDTFVRRLVTLAAPWDGSFKAISAMLFGDNLGIPLLNQAKLQALQSTFPSLMYLFPHEPTWSESETLIQTKSRNYSLDNLGHFFILTNMTEQLMMWQATRQIALSLKPPNVELWCIYGLGVPTSNQIVFATDDPNGKYTEIQGDGDGTVNAASLSACKRFASQQKKPVHVKELANTDHIAILRGTEAANYIANEVLAGDLKPSARQRLISKLMSELTKMRTATKITTQTNEQQAASAAREPNPPPPQPHNNDGSHQKPVSSTY